MASAIVALSGVSKAFIASDDSDPVNVLIDVDLVIRSGAKASLVGPSGSGKSTLLGLIAGLLRPDRGSVVIDGVDLKDLGDRAGSRLRAERVGIALQADNLIPFLTARENVEVACGFGRRHRRHSRTRAIELLDRFGVADRSEHRPRNLSGGEAQRVALAVAMANEPTLLLADEVVAQLDGDTAGQVIDEVLSGDFAVLYVTHDIALADRVAQRYELRDGSIELR